MFYSFTSFEKDTEINTRVDATTVMGRCFTVL